MATLGYTTGIKEILDRTIDWVNDSTIKIMLLANDVTYSHDPDHTVVDMGGATDPADAELSVSGYVGGNGGAGRKVLTSKTITVDNTNNRVVLSAASPSSWTLGPGETVVAAIIIKEDASVDTASRLLIYVDFTDTATNGGTFTLTFHTDGILTINM